MSKPFTARALKCNTAHELINLIKELKITDEEYVFRGVSKIYKCPSFINSGKNCKKKVINNNRMCIPSTSASVAITMLL